MKSVIALVLLFVLYNINLAYAASINLGPVIGVLSEPINNPEDNLSFIRAPYPSWLAAAGSRVVPIFYNSTHAELDNIFNSINGILFAGGADIINHTKYYDAAMYLWQRAIKANMNGDHFPVWGTCLGFELMGLMVADGVFDVLTYFDAQNISLPLKYSSYASTSRIFKDCPSNIYNSLSSSANITSNRHHYGIGINTFRGNAKLTSFFGVIATSFDRENREFVSLMEASKFPFYASQFHPESASFYWEPTLNIIRSPEAVEAMQYFARFFVNECRRSRHTFPNVTTLVNALLENYRPALDADGAESVYTFI